MCLGVSEEAISGYKRGREKTKQKWRREKKRETSGAGKEQKACSLRKEEVLGARLRHRGRFVDISKTGERIAFVKGIRKPPTET